ncbi:MAG: hypothetical protein QOG21_466 [Actinomycetota bacterium]|nr:hypothetical protein [Actinomycetota bacterium]
MTDTGTLLRSLEPKMAEPRIDLESVLQRQGQLQRRKRVEAGILGVGLTIALVAGLLTVGDRAGKAPAADGGISTLPPATIAVPALEQGQYSYLRSVLDQSTTGSTVDGAFVAGNFETSRESEWWATDGSGRIVSSATGRDRTYEPGQFPVDVEKPGLSALPSDTAALQHALLGADVFSGSPVSQEGGAPGQSLDSIRVTRIVADLMTYPSYTPLAPAQRVAILELLSSYQGDGVSVDLHATDPAGRPAYLVSFRTTSGPTQYDYYVDPATHDLLADVEMNARTGQADLVRVVVSAGITSTTTDVPTSSWIDSGSTIHIDTRVPSP